MVHDFRRGELGLEPGELGLGPGWAGRRLCWRRGAAVHGYVVGVVDEPVEDGFSDDGVGE